MGSSGYPAPTAASPTSPTSGDHHPHPPPHPVLVFLGGSCNPTTWRTEIAIPILQSLGLSYYNPQVADWTPELLKLENEAKEKAQVLFFVLDNETRSTAAMIEVAHALGRGQKLVLVINKYSWPGTRIAGEEITHNECEDLKNCQLYLEDLAKSNGVHVYESIDVALRETARIIHEGSKGPPDHLSLKTSLPSSPDSSPSSPPTSLSQSSFSSTTSSSSYTSSSSSSSDNHRRIHSPNQYHPPNYNDPSEKLGEDFKSLCTLNNNGSSSSCRTRTDVTNGRRVLLFLITKYRRSLIQMILASYFLGRGDKMIICIQELPPDTIIDGERLSEQAIKDYNRGRAYLADLARSAEIPVYTCIRDAFSQYMDDVLK